MKQNLQFSNMIPFLRVSMLSYYCNRSCPERLNRSNSSSISSSFQSLCKAINFKKNYCLNTGLCSAAKLRELLVKEASAILNCYYSGKGMATASSTLGPTVIKNCPN